MYIKSKNHIFASKTFFFNFFGDLFKLFSINSNSNLKKVLTIGFLESKLYNLVFPNLLVTLTNPNHSTFFQKLNNDVLEIFAPFAISVLEKSIPLFSIKKSTILKKGVSPIYSNNKLLSAIGTSNSPMFINIIIQSTNW